MKHLFVSSAIALILKEKGFDEPCFAYYCRHRNTVVKPEPEILHKLFPFLDIFAVTSQHHFVYQECSAPLYQQVVDWFRDKHSIYIAVLPFREKSDVSDEYGIELCWYYSIVQDDEDLPDILCNEDDLGAHGLNYATPKEAYDEAFNEALKLI